MQGCKKSYRGPDGTIYESRKAYCNATDLDSDLIYLFLLRGERTPQNDAEKRWKTEADELRRKGIDIELPFE